MEGHRYFIKGIPKALWKEYKHACIYFETTAKDDLISCMQTTVVTYHRALKQSKPGKTYNLNRKDKK